jgi:hypothetical protein
MTRGFLPQGFGLPSILAIDERGFLHSPDGSEHWNMLLRQLDPMPDCETSRASGLI